MLWLVNPDEEILDWKAVCGKIARTVWRLLAFSNPIRSVSKLVGIFVGAAVSVNTI